MKTIKALTVVLAGLLLSTCQTEKSQKVSLNWDELTAQFQNPTNAYRAKPFWAWNGELEEDELRRQIGVMKEMGFGGFFMHSRTGLKTEYLGEKWFDVTAACVDEAKKQGMEAWLYDEDRWPSGLAGGLVTQYPEYRMKYVSLYTPSPNEFSWNDSILAVFTCTLDSINISNIQRIKQNEKPELINGETLLVFVEEKMASWSFYNGYTYLNTLKREATDKFIEITHEAYKERFGDEFGTGIKGIFTDEPHGGCVFGGFGMQNENARRMTPWTDEMPERFQQEYGYDLVDKLPEMFFCKDGAAVSPVKYHYMALKQQMYIDNFAKPYHEWCRNNNMILTGHALHENTLAHQALMQGSLMRNYEYFDYPGIDFLGSRDKPFWIAKQLSSVARQLNKPFLLTETYGVTGWHTNFETYKYIGDWQALYGINLRCPHLSWYTMEGEAKRDYPASIFYQSAWYKDYKNIEDYFARLGLMLSQGQADCHLLVLNPVESLWAQIHTGWAQMLSPTGQNIKDLQQQYEQTFTWLQQAKIDFDYGDEDIMARHYTIEKSTDDKPVLKIGHAAYQTVLVSGMVTMRASTLSILKEFKQAGGEVIFTGNVPEYVDAVKTNDLHLLAAESILLPFNNKALVGALQKVLPNIVMVTDAAGNSIDDVFCQVKIDGNRKIIALLNTSRELKYDKVLVKIPYQGNVSEWNCKTGKQYMVNTTQNETYQVIETNFFAGQAQLYVVSPNLHNLPKKTEYITQKELNIQGPFSYSLSEPNILVLDMAAFSIDGKKISENEEVLRIDQQVRSRFGMPHRQGKMLQPWFRKKMGPVYKAGGKVEMHFSFEIKVMPQGELFLVVERPNYKSFQINGQTIKNEPQGWFIDNALQKIPVDASLLKQGINTIGVTMHFTEEMDIEAMYLTGNFGVDLNNQKPILVSLPEQIEIGDLVAQQLPFYSGKITYKIPVPKQLNNQPLSIEFPGFEAACINIIHDSKHIHLGWQPYQAVLDVTKDFVDVEVVLTRRNTFGPLHLLPKLLPVIGPPHFITTGKKWSYDYQLYPSGLLDKPIFKIKEEI